MNRKFELHTEDKNREGIERIVKSHFSSFSIQGQIGFWQGGIEKSLCIVITGTKKDVHAVVDIARRIKTLNKQDSVLVVKTLVHGTLI